MSKFGTEFMKIWPTFEDNAPNLTDFGKSLLFKSGNLKKPTGNGIAINDFMRKSADFPLKFGTNTCRVLSQPVERYPLIVQQISSAYPIIHERVLGLYLAFLEHKCRYGNDIERHVYWNLTLTEFVQRLLTKRCVTFTDYEDNYLLLSGEKGSGGFKQIGTLRQKPPFVLESLLSYDEMKLSAFLSVSSYTDFINDGNRDNLGYIEHDKKNFEQAGVVIGLIGGRFQRHDVMESQDILISKSQNTRNNGYGGKDIDNEAECENRATDYRRIWNNFYDTQDFLFVNVLNANDPRFFEFRFYCEEEMIFDNVMMKKRYAISIDTLLLEAEDRAAKAGKQAYVHVVGIGLGVWLLLPQQELIFLEAFTERIKVLLPKLKHISVLDFSWFRYKCWGELQHCGLFRDASHPNGGIKTFLTQRNPAAKLPAEYENCLLVVSYAWDSNALPGNEFWEGFLGNSSDSATASSSLITELHNPHINTELVNGNNLHIATLNHGVMHIQDYCRNILQLF